MEKNTNSAISETLGIRFKTGLQSALGNLKSPSKANGDNHTKPVIGLKPSLADALSQEQEVEVNESLLGDAEHGDEDCNDALLGDDVSGKQGITEKLQQGLSTQSASVVTNNHPNLCSPANQKEQIDLSVNSKDNDIKIVSVKLSYCQSENNQTLHSSSTLCSSQTDTSLTNLPCRIKGANAMLKEKDSSSIKSNFNIQPTTINNSSLKDDDKLKSDFKSKLCNSEEMEITETDQSKNLPDECHEKCKTSIKTDTASVTKEDSVFTDHSGSLSLSVSVVNETTEQLDSSDKLTSLQELSAVQNVMEDLLEKTVAKIDGNPVTSVRTNRASPHVSPSNSDDECEDLVIGAGSPEDISDDDSLNDIPAKKVKLDISPAGGRLDKLISHLNTALVEDTSKNHLHTKETLQDAVYLEKNLLASFYDAIIKKDIMKSDYHKELARRHNDLQSRGNVDSRKITKILHEVKSVREKLKTMNVRPVQRSVSTQIFSSKLQAPEQSGTTIIKSKVLSQKALVEAQQRQKYSDNIPGRGVRQLTTLAGQTKAKLPSVSSLASSSPKLSTALVSQPVLLHFPPQHSTPVSNKFLLPKPSSTKSSEVIDLTAEDEAIVKTSATSSPSKLLNLTGSNLKNLHPAPLPATPLTGKLNHLLKPPSPRLELTSKADGIVLQWNMQVTKSHAKISTYQIFGYKERPGPLTGAEWKKVGDLKALPLPMACTLTQFQTGHIYHFAVRAVDEYGRTGDFGIPRSTQLY